MHTFATPNEPAELEELRNQFVRPVHQSLEVAIFSDFGFGLWRFFGHVAVKVPMAPVNGAAGA